MSPAPPTHAAFPAPPPRPPFDLRASVPAGSGGLPSPVLPLGKDGVGLFEHGQDKEPARQRQMASQSWRQARREGGGVLTAVTSGIPGGTEEAAEKFPGRRAGWGPGDRAQSPGGPHGGGDHCGWAEGRAETSFSLGLGERTPRPPVRGGTWMGRGWGVQVTWKSCSGRR